MYNLVEIYKNDNNNLINIINNIETKYFKCSNIIIKLQSLLFELQEQINILKNRVYVLEKNNMEIYNENIDLKHKLYETLKILQDLSNK